MATQALRPLYLGALMLALGASPAFAKGTQPTPQPAAPTATATPAATPAAAPAVLSTPAGTFIQHLGDRAIDILKDKTTSQEQKDLQFRDMLRDSFDLPTIARFVLGRAAWTTATPEQQTEYMKLFEELVIKTYSDRFNLYKGQSFLVRAVQNESERDFFVKSEITQPNNAPSTSVDWRVRQKGDKLGITDVVVEGVSMSITQRQDFAAVLQRNGGNFSALLDMLRQRIQTQPAPQQDQRT